MASVAQPAFGVPRLEDLPPLRGRAVLVRATLDLPIGNRLGSPIARLRSRMLAATLAYLSTRAARVTVLGDLAAPGAVPDPAHVRRVYRLIRSVGENVRPARTRLGVEDLLALEQLIATHDAFVNDSFQWSHLPLPSLMLPPGRLPAAGGRSVHHDLRIAEELMLAPERPFVAALGGAEPAARLHGLRSLVLRADRVLVGGALSLPVLEAVGRAAGSAPPEFMEECRTLVGLAGRVQHPLELPVDLTVRLPDGSVEVIDRYDDPKGEIVDVGPATATRYREDLEGAGTVLWSGALGRAEEARFAAGTLEVARGLAGSRVRRVVIGGDCLASALRQHGRLTPNLSLVSATDPLLELLKNGDLPALAALRGSTSQ